MGESTSYWLRFLEHEDEAQTTGMYFEVFPKIGIAWVKATYNHAEYERPAGKVTIAEARAIWKTAVSSGLYEHELTNGEYVGSVAV